MASTVQNVHDQVCVILLEPSGFTLGDISEAEFLQYYRAVMEDFLGRTGIIKGFAFLAQFFGQAQYLYPDFISDISEVFSDGGATRMDYENSISGADRNWQDRVGPPMSWRQDKLAIPALSLYPAPNIPFAYTASTGSGIAAAWVPDGDFTQSQAFIGTLTQAAQVATFATPGTFFQAGFDPTQISRGAVSLIGQLSLMTEDVSLSSPVEHITDDWVVFIKYGILQKIFASDSECRDVLREKWARGLYEQGILLAQAIMGQVEQKN